MGFISDLKGTAIGYFKLALNGVRLKNNSGNLVVRNSGDSADAEITASKINVSGDSLVINSDGAGSGADYKITLTRPTSGMSADYALTFPVDDGSPSQVLSTDGTGVLSWISASSTSSSLKFDSTTLAFGDSSPVTLFTLPANAVVHLVRIIVDTAFNGTPTVSVGISGTTSKYSATTQVDINTADVYDITPSSIPVGTSESLIATYSAGGASQGSARILIGYYIPD